MSHDILTCYSLWCDRIVSLFASDMILTSYSYAWSNLFLSFFKTVQSCPCLSLFYTLLFLAFALSCFILFCSLAPPNKIAYCGMNITCYRTEMNRKKNSQVRRNAIYLPASLRFLWRPIIFFTWTIARKQIENLDLF